MKNLVLERLCWGWYSGWWGGLELVVNSKSDDGSDNDVYRTVDVDWLEVLKRNGGFVLPESKNKNTKNVMYYRYHEHLIFQDNTI